MIVLDTSALVERPCPLLARIWELRHNTWSYDAAYVALAESLRVELVTVDGQLGGVPGLKCAVRNLREE
jgi:predicted nucleic acid-binding protein